MSTPDAPVPRDKKTGLFAGEPGPGRPPGLTNKVTRAARVIALDLVQSNAEAAQAALDELKGQPRKFLSVYLQLLRILVPRVQVDSQAPLVNINLGHGWPKADPNTLAQVYSEVMGGRLDLNSVLPQLEHQPEEVQQ